MDDDTRYRSVRFVMLMLRLSVAAVVVVVVLGTLNTTTTTDSDDVQHIDGGVERRSPVLS